MSFTNWSLLTSYAVRKVLAARRKWPRRLLRGQTAAEHSLKMSSASPGGLHVSSAKKRRYADST